jgi:hypothetical protein
MPAFSPTPAPVMTIWDAPVTANQRLPGIWHVTTASHGGFILSEERQAASVQLDRLREPHRHMSIEPIAIPHAEPTDPLEAAIQQAQAEIRDLIESGDLSLDEVTSGWIETWAADLYREDRKAA